MNRQQRRMAMKQAARSADTRIRRLSDVDLAAYHFQAGRILQGEAACRAILAGGTKDAQSLHRLGWIAHQVKRHEVAAELISRAICLKPNEVEAYPSLSSVLKALGRLDDAVEVCRKAIALRRDFAESHNALGRVLQDKGLFSDAAASYREAISCDPGHSAAHFNLGLLFAEQGDMDAACVSFQEAARIRPDFVDAHRRAAGILREQERLDAAATYLRRALEIDPKQSSYYADLGLLLTKQGRLLEGVEAYRAALAIKPDDTAALNNLGNVLDELGKLDEAAAAYQFSVKVDPANLTAFSNLGMVLRKKNRVREAIDSFRKVLAINPANHTALGELYQLRLAACDWDRIDQDEASVLDLCRRRATNEIPPFVVLTAPTATAEDQMNGAISWSANYAVPESRKFRHFAPPKVSTAERPIRVGYLSADFYSHATAFLAAELFEKHDRSRFRISAYSLSKDDQTAIRHRLVRAFDDFVDIRKMSEANAAQKIYDDQIDILVDLKGHTQDARTKILAYRPAPIQVTYLGYPGTMGADFIDYIIGDAIVAPTEHQRYYTEKLVHLPNSYQPNDTKRDIANEGPTRAECGLPADAFVFCCFNNNYKLTPALFDVWMRLLDAVPNSVLWLIEANDIVRDNLIREAAARGIDAGRLIFAPKMPVLMHLARHRHADLFLDTLPVNAHTTASDALWAGLPVVTCLGETFVGRVAASLLRAVGLPELITSDLQAYENLALKLATNPTMLAEVKQKLAHNRLTTPLFDIDNYTRHLERAYMHMAAVWRSGRPPEAFAVADLLEPTI